MIVSYKIVLTLADAIAIYFFEVERCTTKRIHEDSFKIDDTNSGYVVRDGNGDGDELRDGQDVKNQTGEKSESSENLSSINYTGSVVKNTTSDQVNENGVYLEDSMLLHTTTRKVLRIVDLRPFINAKVRQATI